MPEFQPAEFQPAEFQPAESQPTEFQPAEFQPAEFQPAEPQVMGSDPVESIWLTTVPVFALWVVALFTAA